MKKLWAVSLLFVSAAGLTAQTANYRAPRTAEGQPDLQGVWNFSSAVPLERPSKFGDRKVATKEEIEAHARALDAALKMVATFAPVEAIGVLDLDHVSHVDDLRTSFITYPDNGRMPKLQEGATSVPTTDSHQNFSPAERCLVGGPVRAALERLPHVVGRCARTLGRRHARRRDTQLQQPDAEFCRRGIFAREGRDRALHAARTEAARLRSDRRRSDGARRRPASTRTRATSTITAWRTRCPRREKPSATPRRRNSRYCRLQVHPSAGRRMAFTIDSR